MQKIKAMILIGFIALFLIACTTIPSGEDRTASAFHSAKTQGWKSSEIDAGAFRLLSFFPIIQPSSETLTVFIEGDGLAWLSRSKPSFDPTPINPISLNLALQFPTNTAVAYLARPCQYLIDQNTNCSQKYWTSHRFSSEVIKSQNIALDKLKITTGASKLRLIGYSGGGAIASLLAAYRDDVTQLITVAGNLDHQAWTTYHRLTPLHGSLNPVDVRSQIAHIPQVHFIGENDTVVPAEVVKRFIEFNPPNTQVKLIPGADHNCCWETELNVFFQQNKLTD
jgi:dienelactone hydrolase